MENQFKDSTCRAWTLTLNLRTANQIARQCGVTIVGEVDTAALVNLEGERMKLGDALWLCCAGSAGDVTREQFDESLDGPALDAGFNALVAAVVDFAPAPRREAIRETIDRQREAVARVAETAVERLRSPEFAQFVSAKIADHVGQLDKLMASRG